MRADRITRAAVLVVAVGFVWRNHVGQPGLATHDVFPASLGVSSAGGFEVQRWSSRESCHLKLLAGTGPVNIEDVA